MDQAIMENNKSTFIKLLFVKLIEFLLFYVRNFLFVGAVLFIFLGLMVIFVFFQDELHIDPVYSFFTFADNTPVIGTMIELPRGNMSFDETDIINFFVCMSLYLTLFTEAIRYFVTYVLKHSSIKDHSFVRLKKRIVLVVIGISVIYFFSACYVILSTGGKDLFGFVLVFTVFWTLCCISSTLFLLADVAAKNVHKVLDHMNSTSSA